MSRSFGLAAIFGLTVLLVGCGGAAPAADRSENAAQSEGIEVHGDWRVSILNEDGSLDRAYVFTNAMRDGAGDLLGQLLTVNWDDPFDGYPTPLFWSMTFGETGTLAVPPDTGIVPGVGPCGSFISTSTAGANPLLTTGCDLNPLLALVGGEPDGTLVVTTIDDGIRLSGSVDATQQGNINYVETQLVVATGEPTGFPPFPPVDANAFTGTAVGPFEDILPGQTIQVQVDITFASPAP